MSEVTYAVVDMQLRSVDLTNFIYITDASMQYIGRITTYVLCDTDEQNVCVATLTLSAAVNTL